MRRPRPRSIRRRLFGLSAAISVLTLTIAGILFIINDLSMLRQQMVRDLDVLAVVIGDNCLAALALSLLLAWRLQRRISEPILGLAVSAEKISEQGDYGKRVTQPPSFVEIDTLVSGLNQLLAAIQVRESALRAHADALDTANSRLRSLATEISLVEERERKRLATELHDSAMQKLAIARLQIAGVAERLAHAPEAAHDERLEVGLILIREVLGELRSLQFELSPPSLYLGGLPQALQSLAAHMTARCGIAIDYVEPDEVPAPPLELAVVLYQCARELV